MTGSQLVHTRQSGNRCAMRLEERFGASGDYLPLPPSYDGLTAGNISGKNYQRL